MKQLLSTLQTWWVGTSQREQRLLIVCSVLLFLGVIYWGILQPVSQRAEMATNRIQSEKQLLNWVKDKADNISQLRAQGGVASSSLPLNRPFLQRLHVLVQSLLESSRVARNCRSGFNRCHSTA